MATVTTMKRTYEAHKMTEANLEIARKEVVLDAAIGSNRDAKDCGDFSMVEKVLFVGNKHECAKRFI
eukprot:4191368-Ditylum_brightwellii.AAC.1